MNFEPKYYVSPFDKKLLNVDYREKLIKKLGLNHFPNYSFYRFFVEQSLSGIKGILRDNFKIYGEENTRDNEYQLYLFNRESNYDSFVLVPSIIRASRNALPISSMEKDKFIFNGLLGSFSQKIYFFPSFFKKEKNFSKSCSLKNDSFLDYSEFCLFHGMRLLAFPFDEFEKGRSLDNVSNFSGTSELLWRFYNHLHQLNFWEKGKRIQIIPGNISYDPSNFSDFFRGRHNGSMIRVRFGKSINNFFEKNVFDEFYSCFNRIRTFKNVEKKESLKLGLQKKFMQELFSQINNLMTLNIGHLGFRIVYNFSKFKKNKNPLRKSFLEKSLFKSTLLSLVQELQKRDFYVSEQFSKNEDFDFGCSSFFSRCEKEGLLKDGKDKVELNTKKICSKNLEGGLIFKNYQKLENLPNYKNLEKDFLVF